MQKYEEDFRRITISKPKHLEFRLQKASPHFGFNEVSIISIRVYFSQINFEMGKTR